MVFAIVPLLVVIVPSIQRFQSVQQKSVLEHESQVAADAAQQINHFLEIQFRSLEEAGLFFPEIREGDPKSELYIERVLFKNDQFVEVAVVGSDGQELMRKHRYQVVRAEDFHDRSGTEGFSEVMEKGFYISDVYFDQGRPFFTIGVLTETPREAAQGALFAEVDARVMQKVVREISLAKERGRSYIVNDEGVVIAHPNISLVLAKENFRNIPLVDHMLEGSSVYNESYENEEGVQVLGAWERVTVSLENGVETQWYVISEEEVEYALRHVQEMQWFALAAIAIVGLLIVPGVFWVSNKILVPIKKVHSFVNKVGEGDFSQRVHIEGEDELGDMARGVNSMVDSLEKARERNKLISDMKSEFLSIAAHQLRTPLSALRWTFDMLIAGDIGRITKKQKEFLERGNETTERIISLVNDLLNVSRIEEGKFGYEMKEISLENLVQTLSEETRTRAEQKKLKFTFQNPNEPLPKVKADEEKLSLAITNLLDNALKYTPAGGQVDVFLEKRNDSILFKVQDTGVGIPNDSERSKLFTKFHRGQNAKKLQTVGSGLGLFLVKNIIEAHNGKIWMESEENEGSTFYFTIPVASRHKNQ